MSNNKFLFQRILWATWGIVLSFILAATAFAKDKADSSSAVANRFANIPVEITTGELKYRQNPEIFIKGRGPDLSLSRIYRSHFATNGIFGYGWAWNHCERLNFGADGLIEMVTPDSIITMYEGRDLAEKYAQTCDPQSEWNNESAATGEPDANGSTNKVAWIPAYNQWNGKSYSLTAHGWGFTDPDPDGEEEILKVVIGCLGATESPMPPMMVKLTAGQSYKWWGHVPYDSAILDIISEDPDGDGWTWDEINNIHATICDPMVVAPQGTKSAVYIDTFYMQVVYARADAAGFQLPRGATFTMEKSGSDYLMTYKDKSKVLFDEDGKLKQKEDRNGNKLYFTYNAGLLTNIHNEISQSLTFRYNASGKVTNVVDHLGRSCSYAYSGDDLTQFTDLE